MNANKSTKQNAKRNVISYLAASLRNMWTRITSRLRLWRQKTVFLGGGQSATKASNDSRSWNIYTSCKELSLSRFIDISIDGNMALLDPEYNGEGLSSVPPDILLKAWTEISLEYTQLMDNGKLKTLLKNGVDSEVLRLELDVIYSVVNVLSTCYDTGLVKILKGYGYNFNYDYKNPESYFNDLAKVISLSKRKKVEILTKEEEINRASTDEGSKREATKEDWIRDLVALSDDSGYKLDPDQISVFEYTVRYKNLLDKIKLQRKQNSKIQAMPKPVM